MIYIVQVFSCMTISAKITKLKLLKNKKVDLMPVKWNHLNLWGKIFMDCMFLLMYNEDK